MNSPVIKPTVGRVLYFYPAANSADASFARRPDGGGPYTALIAYVWSDGLVNLTVFDANGIPHSRTSVPLWQDPLNEIPSQDFCGWMPYQKGQAAKTEAAEKAAAEAPATAQYREPTQRNQLEYALVSGAAAHLAQVPKSATDIANAIKVVLDALHPPPVLFNPHTGMLRDPRDVASDPQAILCAKPGEPLKDAPITLPVVDPGPDSLEREIQAKANKGPRVTPAALQAEITHCYFINAGEAHRANWPDPAAADETHPSLDLLTICVLVLRNGFTVHGVSACASPENFNAEIGRRIARENAVNKVWPLLGFRLRDELARPVLTDGDAAADLAGTCRPDNHTSACTACKRGG